MGNFGLKAIKKLKKNSRIERSLAGLLMDIFYFGTSFLIMQGVSLIPVRANAILIILLVYIFHYLYRYVFIREIGGCGRPLHIQLNIQFHWIILNIFDGVFALTMPLFSMFLIMFSTTTVISDYNFKQHSFLIPMSFMIALPLTIVGLCIYINQRESIIPVKMTLYPKSSSVTRKLLTIYFIPALAIVAGCSLSIFSHSFFEQMNNPSSFLYSPNVAPFIFMSFFIFMPFRYLVMRTAGASLVSAVSFVLSVFLICTGHLTKIFNFH